MKKEDQAKLPTKMDTEQQEAEEQSERIESEPIMGEQSGTVPTETGTNVSLIAGLKVSSLF